MLNRAWRCSLSADRCRTAFGALLVAGLFLLEAAPSRAEKPPAFKNIARRGKSVSGCLLDANGRPVEDATVWLTRLDDGDDDDFAYTVIAQTHSQSNGHFQLNPAECELNKPTANPPVDFVLWTSKPGLAFGYLAIYGDATERPVSLTLLPELAVSLRVRTPGGSPCGGARVSPALIWLPCARWQIIPKPIQERLAAHSGADGGVELHGVNAKFACVTIDSPDSGTQTLAFGTTECSPIPVTLREARVLQGRVTLPKGETADFSKLALVLAETSPGPNFHRTNRAASSKKCECSATEPRPDTWCDKFVVHFDCDGRFTIAKFPKSQHGNFQFRFLGETAQNLVLDRVQPRPTFDVPLGQPVRVEIPMRKGIWVTRQVRDARTLRPVRGIDVEMRSSQGFIYSGTSDQSGASRIRVCPGDTYRVHCELPAGYTHVQAGGENDVVVPAGVDRLDLQPIDLVQECSVSGSVVDASGQPAAGIRVRCNLSHGDNRAGKLKAADTVRWTTTDSAGGYCFEQIEAGTRATLVAVRQSLVLGNAAKIVAGDNKPVRLEERKQVLTAFEGRVLGTDKQPIPGAQVIVEVEHSADPAHALRMTVDNNGSFHTPAIFPTGLKYRVTACSLLEKVASSEWVSPVASFVRFPDLVADRREVSPDFKLPESAPVALVNGQLILAREILERAATDPLPPLGRNLLRVGKDVSAGLMSQREFRKLEEEAIKKYIEKYVKHRVLTQALDSMLSKEQREQIDQAVQKMFDQYVEKIRKDMKADSRGDVEERLRRQGTSLASLRVAFRCDVLAKEYVRSLNRDLQIDPGQLFAYYQAHRDAYAVPAKVSWQMLEIQFEPQWNNQRRGTEKNDTQKRDTKEHQAQHPIFETLDTQSGRTERTQNEFAWPNKDTTASAVLEELEPVPVKQGSRADARDKVEKALALLQKGESFDSVVKKVSNGPNFQGGGWQVPISPDTLADRQTAEALSHLGEGKMTGIIQTDHSFRIVRIACRTPATVKPFEEAEASIRHIKSREYRDKTLREIFFRACVESPYITDASSLWKTIKFQSSAEPRAVEESANDAFAD